MNLLYIGGGFVGTCSAAVAANSGHQVLVFDIDEKKVEMLSCGDRDIIESCLYEEGLGDLLVRNSSRITFTTDYNNVKTFLDTCDTVFLCLNTPEIGETGESDLSYYDAAAKQLAQVLARRNAASQEKYIVIVNKSTVPIDTVDRTNTIMAGAGVLNYGVVSNPEFLVEGKAIQGSLKPDRVVIGAHTEKDFSVMRQIYQRFYGAPDVQYIEVNPKEAAAGKLLANFYLFNKLAVCFDVIGRTCEAFEGINFENLRKILTTDERIGTWGFYDSLYAGGSCFIKDARSLSHQLQTAGEQALLINETYMANKRQLELFLARAVKEAHVQWSGKTVAVLGLAFKRDTNDVRNSPAIDIVNFLREKGVQEIRLYDPAAATNFSIQFSEHQDLHYCVNETEAVNGVDVVIIATDWPQFRGLGDMLLTQSKQKPLIMDGRRMLAHRYKELQAAGCDIIAVGSPFLKGIKSRVMNQE